MIVHQHEIAVPAELAVAAAGEVTLLHADPARALVIAIHPVTRLEPERWIRTHLVDAPIVALREEACFIGDNRCRRVTVTHPALRRVVVFIEARDGSEGALPVVLAAPDDRHDRDFETLVASVRDTRQHPFAMWAD